MHTKPWVVASSGVAVTVAVAIWIAATHDKGPPPVSLLVLPILGVAFVAIVALYRSKTQLERERGAAIESKTRFSRLFHSSPVAMCLSTLDDGTVLEINSAYEHLFSLNKSQVVGRTPQQAGLVFDVNRREALFVKMRDRGWLRDEEISVETCGGRRDVLISSQVVDVEGVKYSSATFLDITERLRAERQAKDSEQRFRELAENVEEVFFVCSVDGSEIQYMSPAYEQMFGRSRDRLERDPIDWVNAVHHGDRPRVMAMLKRPPEARHDDVFRVVLPGGSVRNLKTTFFPIRDLDGAIVRIAGIASDITKQLELEEQVRQSQKLESLGLLAGGVAHDFNNILAVIGSNISMLGETTNTDDKELVDEVQNAVTRGASLTRQLLAFSRRQVVEPKVLDVNRIVEDTRKMLRRMVGDDIRLSCSLDPELHHVTMDSGVLVQVLMNLAVNARDAMPTGGSLSITTRNAGDEVMIEVCDSGCGMPAEVQARIFEPFFTTKGVGKGTGLGLSVVHGIVQQAGGRISLVSHIGVGTTFSIHLPATIDVVSSTAKEDGAECAGVERILLVDDDVFVRTSAARALRTKGYTVIEAGDGQSALEILIDDGHAIALLVTDVVMPGMDGRQLVEAARSRRPSLPVLFTSGYTDDAVLLHGVRRDEVAFLEKPFRTRQLAGRVRRLLDVERQPPARR
jgi:two-component system cell cycle sensor histidine kinase/response regulator CckA